MILLIGGTSETAPLAAVLAAAGYAVLVSTATETPLAIGDHPRIARRSGRLDAEKMAALIAEKGIRAIVDAAHPYAVEAHRTAREAAARLAIPCLLFCRPALLTPAAVPPEGGPSASGPPAGRGLPEITVAFAADHAAAAALAFADRRPVLLTTGSRNLAPYADAARKTGIPLWVRVLDAPESLTACREAGIPAERIIAGRGPFSVEENLALIGRCGIGVLVSKESGRAGGLDAKLAAARLSGCRIVVIGRPSLLPSLPVFSDPADLVAALKDLLPPGGHR